MLAILSAYLDFLSIVESIKKNGITTWIFGITTSITSPKQHTLNIHTHTRHLGGHGEHLHAPRAPSALVRDFWRAYEHVRLNRDKLHLNGRNNI